MSGEHVDRVATVIAPEELGALVTALQGRGYLVLGPTVRDGAIVYDELGVAACS